jgi:hypothetical protein
MKASVKVKNLEGFTQELKDMNVNCQVMKSNPYLVKFETENVEQFVQVLDIYGRYDDI